MDAHINLLYPFAHDSTFPEAVNAIKKAVSTVAPFKLTFAKFECFKHGKSCTMWLSPEPKEEVVKLQKKLEEAFPAFNDLSTMSNAGFTPHLSVGQWSKNEIDKQITIFQSGWKPIEFEVSEIHVISRTGDAPFQVRYTVPFIGEVQHKNPITPVVREDKVSNQTVYVSNLPFAVQDEELCNLFKNKGLNVISCKIIKQRGFGFVEFASPEDQQKALEIVDLSLNGRNISVKPAKKN